MNEWERLSRQAQRYKETYPPGTRIMLLGILYYPAPKTLIRTASFPPYLLRQILIDAPSQSAILLIDTTKNLFARSQCYRCRIVLDDPNPIESGTVKIVDDIGTLHCDFDNGRSLGVVPGVDSFRTLADEELAEDELLRERSVAMAEDREPDECPSMYV